MFEKIFERIKAMISPTKKDGSPTPSQRVPTAAPMTTAMKFRIF
jgi:hypothetical protein